MISLENLHIKNISDGNLKEFKHKLKSLIDAPRDIHQSMSCNVH